MTARAFGAFGRAQTALGVRARLSYVLGREPELFDARRPAPDRGPVFGVPPRAARRPAARRRGCCSSDRTSSDPHQAAVLLALAPPGAASGSRW